MGLVEDLINLQVVQWLNTGSCLDDGIIPSLYVFLVLPIWNYSTEMPTLSLLWPSLGMTEKSRIEQNYHFLIEDIINSITKQKEEGKDEAVKKLKLFSCLSLINPLLWLTNIYLWRLWLCYNRKPHGIGSEFARGVWGNRLIPSCRTMQLKGPSLHYSWTIQENLWPRFLEYSIQIFNIEKKTD